LKDSSRLYVSGERFSPEFAKLKDLQLWMIDQSSGSEASHRCIALMQLALQPPRNFGVAARAEDSQSSKHFIVEVAHRAGSCHVRNPSP
jgi:hypothetical protein